MYGCISLAGHSLLSPFLLSDKRDWTVRLEIYEDIQLKIYTLNKLSTRMHTYTCENSRMCSEEQPMYGVVLSLWPGDIG